MARQRKDGRWEARRQIKDPLTGLPRRFSGYGDTAQEAEDDLELKLIQVNPPRSSPSTSLKAFSNANYLPTIRNHSLKWRKQVAWALDGYIYKTFGHFPITEVKRQQVQYWLASLKLSRTSVGHIRKVFHALMNLAEADDLVPHNPIRHVKLAPVRPTLKLVLNAGQVHALIEASRGASCESAVILAACLGLRRAEIASLKRSDFRGGTLQVLGTKTSAAVREIPYPAAMPALLKFPVGYWSAREELKEACAKANVPPITLHSLRHSFATHLQRLGCPEDARARLLGHGKRGITAGYSHAEMEVWRGWVDAVWTDFYGSGGVSVGSNGQPRNGTK